jgi:hypothetical protein
MEPEKVIRISISRFVIYLLMTRQNECHSEVFWRQKDDRCEDSIASILLWHHSASAPHFHRYFAFSSCPFFFLSFFFLIRIENSERVSLADAVNASTAAPTYFPPVEIYPGIPCDSSPFSYIVFLRRRRLLLLRLLLPLLLL